jgi:Inositol polyphosphate kinase
MEHRADIRLIDFAHVQSTSASPRRDEGVLVGIKTLIQIFETLRDQFDVIEAEISE